VPFQDNPSQTPYEVLAENQERGLHTLLLLDIRAEQNRAMTANEAIDVMLGLEAKLHRKVFTPGTLAIVIARAGSDDAVVRAERIERLREMDFGPPPHVLIVPGKLHFVEAEALEVFAGAPREIVR
jgi:diphthine synthase